jgi:hypothetical protein
VSCRPRVFVSGAYDSGRVILPRFNDARRRLDAAGLDGLQLAPHSWMSDCRELLGTCDGVALLDEWPNTWGATFEVDCAFELGLPVLPLADWLDGSWRA